MSGDMFSKLRLSGYAPRTMLDLGAHIGTFSADFITHFPDCQITMVEPNPYCHPELEKLPFELHRYAASNAPGKGEFFLTSEWLQSTGASLYRENTAFFRDQVVQRVEVDKARVDDFLAGRQFDFVKMDVQGSELDVLIGGEQVLRKADYILVEIPIVEYNLGGPVAEMIFAKLSDMGFQCADVTQFHRLKGAFDGALLQIDFLFRNIAPRAAQAHRNTPLNKIDDILAYLSDRKTRSAAFSVIDISSNPEHGWARAVADTSFAATTAGNADLDDPLSWEPLLQHVSRHGRFSYAICAHRLQTLAQPSVTLKMLPLVAEAGVITVPSPYLEMLRREGPYRGFANHRWVFSHLDNALVAAPKLPLVEMVPNQDRQAEEVAGKAELQVFWQRGIGVSLLAAGASSAATVDTYLKFFARHP